MTRLRMAHARAQLGLHIETVVFPAADRFRLREYRDSGRPGRYASPPRLVTVKESLAI